VEKREKKWIVRANFAICLHNKDKALLELVQSYFGGIGGFSQWNNNILYRVSSLKDISNVIIPHFEKYPLLTQKRADFELFKSVVQLMNKKEHLTSDGLVKIVSIKASLNNGLSPTLTEAFPTITPINRPLVKGIEISDPNWVAGFTEGEGCFNVNIISSKTHKIGAQVQLRFELTQHSRDTELMNSLVKYWGCGKTTVIITKPVVRFNVVKFTEFKDIIVPFFNKFPLYGNKRLDYTCFVKVFMLVNAKAHLTPEGLAQIREIKAGMNTSRKPVQNEIG
jgi:LAGLIDADG endonuclease